MKFIDDSGRKLNAGIILRITLANLTYLSIDSYTIRQIHLKLKVLYFIIRSEDSNPLEKIINSSMKLSKVQLSEINYLEEIDFSSYGILS